MKKQAEVRRTRMPASEHLRPDAKSQVTFRYENGRPVAIDAVVLSTQHAAHTPSEELRELVHGRDHQAGASGRMAVRKTPLTTSTRPASFGVAARWATAGLTGRKIIVDTYGGMARHGGGAFSGKDPSKVDRSAAYAARYAAKNVVAAGLAERCEIQVSYAIGVAEPTSISVETFGTEKVPAPTD